jgi:hypothetical protein
MKHRLFLAGLGALLPAARAELPIDLPAETATNRPVPGINVPAPLRTEEPTNAVAVPPVLAPMPHGAAPGPAAGKPWPWRRVEAPAQGTDRLTYTNGDIFAGAFLGLEDGMIRWKPVATTTPIRFHAAGLDELTFRAQPPANASAPAAWLVFLADGSLLPARQVVIKEGEVVADLAYAGTTRLDRRQVAALRRCDTPEGGYVTFGDAPLYEPAPGKSPRANERPRMRWRGVKLPDPVLLEFAWDGEPESKVNLRPFAGKGEGLGRTPAFEFNLDLAGASAGYKWESQHLLSQDMSRCAGRTVWAGLAVNRRKGEAVLYLDGQRRQRALIEGLLNLPDFGLAVAEKPSRRRALRGVLISRINADLNLFVPPADRDAVRLTNGDQIAGRLEALSNNELIFEAAIGRTTLPLERVAQITFPEPTNAPTRTDEVHLMLRDGSRLLGVWKRADARSVVIQHGVLGAVTIPRNALAEAAKPGAERLWEVPDVDDLPFRLDPRQLSPQEKRLIAEQLRMAPAFWHCLFAFRYRPGLMKLESETSRTAETAATTESAWPGLMQLESDTFWHGELLGIADGIARWQHSASPDPWDVPMASVRQLFPLVRPLPGGTVGEPVTVRLSNGDVVSGAPGEAAEQIVNLTPWYAGPLAIPRRHVALVTPHPAVTNALDPRLTVDCRWEPAPLAVDGALWFESVGRSALQSGPIPDRVRLDFEVVWPPSVERAELAGSPFAESLVQVRVDVGDIANVRGSRLLATVSPRGTKFVSRAAGVGGSESVPPIDGQTHLAAGGCVNITVFADRTKNHLRLLVDGRPAGERRAADLPIPAAYALRLAAGGNTGAALRHIVLREWSEGQPPPPVSRTVAVSPLAPGEVRVVLHNGDFLTLGEIAADERTLTGRHQLLGAVTLNMAAVRAVDGERLDAPCPPGSGAATKR